MTRGAICTIIRMFLRLVKVGLGVQVREQPFMGAACLRPRPLCLVPFLCVSVVINSEQAYMGICKLGL